MPSPTDVNDRRRRRFVVRFALLLCNAKQKRGMADRTVRVARVPTILRVCRRFSPLDASMMDERTSPIISISDL